VPQVVRDGDTFRLDYDRPKSIGKVRGFTGPFGVFVRSYAFIRMWGPQLRRMSEIAVLNANYMLARLRDAYDLPYDRLCMHEFVVSARTLKREHGASALDVAKRLMDYGFHPPTVYFPLVVPEALMIEPTETEAKETLDAFCDALVEIAREAADEPELLKEAPHNRPVRRLDEVRAVKQPVVRYLFEDHPAFGDALARAPAARGADGRMIRVWRIPFSTNVERVALALGHKGVDAEWIDVDPADRTPVREVSGQDLVPVLEEDGRIVHDSTAILEYLEARYPDPPLYPRDEARRAEATLLIDWFNRVWKRPPNLLTARPDDPRAQEWAEELERSRDLFESLLAERAYLLADEFTALDAIAFPFLKYGLIFDPADDEPFHRVLIDHLALEGRYPRLEEWIRRVDARPRA
jgi:glutathione S-transferase